jgi:hypothetical protein
MMGSASNKTRMTELVACSLKDSKFPPIREQINSRRVLGVELAPSASDLESRITTDAVVAGNAV